MKYISRSLLCSGLALTSLFLCPAIVAGELPPENSEDKMVALTTCEELRDQLNLKDQSLLAEEGSECASATAVALDGELEVLVADNFNTGSVEYLYSLITPDGKRLALYLPSAEGKNLMSGSHVLVQGYLFSTSDSILVQMKSGIEIIAQAVAPLATGERRALAILFNFQNTSVTSPTTSVLQGKLFSLSDPKSTANYFKEVSYGKSSLVGKVTPWLRIDSNMSCTATSLHASQATFAAKAIDPTIDFSAYSHLTLVAPYNGCPWSGLGSLGNTWVYTPGGWVSLSVTWINSFVASSTPGIFTHEFGHNLGLGHASFLNCRGLLDSTCISEEYGDLYDTMGSASFNWHYNAIGKERIGWLDSSNVKTVTESGVYRLTRLETADGGIKAIRIPRTSNFGDFIYVERRSSVGFDANIAWSSNVYGGVVLHKYHPQSSSGTALVDAVSPGNDSLNPGLTVNKTFTDPLTGTKIRPFNSTTNTIDVEVIAGNIPLSIQFISPSMGATVSGPMTLAVEAYPSSRIAKVEFSRPSVPREILGTDTAPPYELTVNTLGRYPNSWNRFDATVYDFSGNSAQASISVAINNPDSIPPVILDTWPSEGTVTGSSVEVGALMQDNIGIYNVVFDLDEGKWWSQLYSPPFTQLVEVSEEGSHTLSVGAYDFAWNSVTKENIPFIVDLTPSEPPTNLRATSEKGYTIDLVWDAAKDLNGISEYLVFRNKVRIATTPAGQRSYVDSEVGVNAEYLYEIQAVDRAGNISEQSEPAFIVIQN